MEIVIILSILGVCFILIPILLVYFSNKATERHNELVSKYFTVTALKIGRVNMCIHIRNEEFEEFLNGATYRVNLDGFPAYIQNGMTATLINLDSNVEYPIVITKPEGGVYRLELIKRSN